MKENELKRVKLSLIFNLLIFVFTIFSCYAMFTGLNFMSGEEKYLLSSASISMFKYFTVDSNILIGLASLIFAIEDIKVLRNSSESISKEIYLFKLAATSAVTLTFVVVFTYLVPIVGYGFIAMIMNSNLFFHLITPLLSIFTFVLFEKTNLINKKEVIIGIVPTILYAIYYLTNVGIHATNGKVLPQYDWYYFVQGGVWTAGIVVPIILLVTYVISLLLWKTNKE